MFLDRTDLSKTVDRHGKERCHVLSRSSRFFLQPFFLNGSPFLLNEGHFLQETAESCKDRRPWQARTDRSNLLEYSNSMSFFVATSFSMFSHRFSSVFGLFTIVQGSVKTRSTVCRPLFKGLLKPFKAGFVLFPSKFAYWLPVCALIDPTPPEDSSTT